MQPVDVWERALSSSGKSGNGSGAGEKREVAAYIAGLSRDLSLMSRRNGFTTLAYLLDMARLEADTVARSGADETSTPGLDRP